MLFKVQKWGNSQGIRIPKNLLKNSHINVGEEVDITVQEAREAYQAGDYLTIQDYVSKYHKKL